MNSMLQKHCAKFLYVTPDGLKELMSDISREVIRCQPEQLYTFIADYLDALLLTRENARIACKLVETISEIAETTVNLLNSKGLDREEADRIVTLIQRYFRDYLARKKLDHQEVEGEFDEIDAYTKKIMLDHNVDADKLNEVVEIIQNAYRNFKIRQKREHESLCGMVDWRVAARSAIALYRKTGVTNYEANRAATLIKAAYKSYYTRRVMRKIFKQADVEEIETGEESGEGIDEIEETEFESSHIYEDTEDEFTLDEIVSVNKKETSRASYEGEGAEFYTLPGEIVHSDTYVEPDEFHTLPGEIVHSETYIEPDEFQTLPAEIVHSATYVEPDEFQTLPAEIVHSATYVEPDEFQTLPAEIVHSATYVEPDEFQTLPAEIVHSATYVEPDEFQTLPAEIVHSATYVEPDEFQTLPAEIVQSESGIESPDDINILPPAVIQSQTNNDTLGVNQQNTETTDGEQSNANDDNTAQGVSEERTSLAGDQN